MKISLRPFRFVPLPLVALAAAIGVTSCKLPPREALARIQQDTLVGYFATAQSESVARSAQQSVSNVDVTETTHPNMVVASSPREVPTLAPSFMTPSPRVNSRAEAVPGKPGYAYTPFVPGKKMVDVRGFAPGDKVLCPYTRKAFLVPSPTGNAPASASNVAATTPPRQMAPTTVVRPRVNTTPADQPNAPTKPKPSSMASSNKAPEAPKKEVAANGAKPKPESKPDPKKQVAGTKPSPSNGNSGKKKAPGNMAATKPAANGSNGTAAKPAPAPSDDLPSGTPVPGKPNYVYSPFAKKNQIVDVQGLEPGTKVRCPYTGKLFRVPAGAQ
ncbi:MAG: hypothetical protein AAGJ79_07930 [Verrucomicrobiota bacterium]